jgi:hypothetical protein
VLESYISRKVSNTSLFPKKLILFKYGRRTDYHLFHSVHDLSERDNQHFNIPKRKVYFGPEILEVPKV